MANFREAYDITLGHEGGYVFDVDDPGGETYCGISRKYHSEWIRWLDIDKIKQQNGPIKKGTVFPEFSNDVRSFYKANFWDVFKGDQVPDQNIANEVFDTGVNMYTGDAVVFMQIGLNVLNKNATLWPDIDEDGKVGPGTMTALKKCIDGGDGKNLYKIMNVEQGHHYITEARKNSIKEKYMRGWLNRVDFIRS